MAPATAEVREVPETLIMSMMASLLVLKVLVGSSPTQGERNSSIEILQDNAFRIKRNFPSIGLFRGDYARMGPDLILAV
jgi:hypothetical protein